MATDDFWLLLHDLTKALEQQGRTRPERQGAILNSLANLQPPAADEMRREYEFVVDELEAMRPAVRRKKNG